MKNTRLYIAGLVIMLILNGVLIFLLLQKPSIPRSFELENRGGNLKEKISTQLQLTENQIKAYEELANEHHRAIQITERKQKEIIRTYFLQLKESSPDSTFLNSQLLQIQALDSKKIKLTYTHFNDLKALCTNEQRAKFEEYVDEILMVLLNEQKNMPPPPRGAREN